MLIILAKHKKKLILVPLAAGVLAGGLSLLMPNIYMASTRILPPQQAQSGAAALLSQLGSVAGAAAGAAGVKNPNDTYLAMLKSRTIADKLVARFNLKSVYDQDTFDQTRKLLADNSTIAASKDGLISVDVEDKDKKRATEMANAYVAELQALTKVLAVSEASQRRLFFERQLEDTKNKLAAAEMSLSRALELHGVVSVDSDSRAVVETVSRMRAQIAAKEIQLNSMRAFVTTDNQEYKRTAAELSSLRGEFDKLQNGRPAGETSQRDAGKVGGLENIKILRDVKYQQMLYELLAKQYEAARLDEAKDSSMIQVLDVAVEPERKFKPKRAIIALLGAILGMFAAVGWAYLAERNAKAAHSAERRAQMARLKSYLW